MTGWSFFIVAKNVRAWRIFRTNPGTIMAVAMDTPRQAKGGQKAQAVFPASIVAAAIAQEIFDHARNILQLGKPA
jgi:hypothetical protein